MNRNLLLFTVVFSLFLLLCSCYLVIRVGPALPLHGMSAMFSTAAFMILVLQMPAVLVIRKVSTVPMQAPLQFGYSFFGILSVILAFVLLRDLGWGIGRMLSLVPTDEVARGQWLTYSSRIALVAGVGISLVSWYVARRPARLREVNIRIPDLHPDLVGLRIAHISDIHLDQTTSQDLLRNIVRRTNALKPDLVALTGDLVDGSVRELASQAEALRGLEAPCFYVTGNHEVYAGALEWRQFLSDLGVEVMDQLRC